MFRGGKGGCGWKFISVFAHNVMENLLP
jgi:hypothetical protein